MEFKQGYATKNINPNGSSLTKLNTTKLDKIIQEEQHEIENLLIGATVTSIKFDKNLIESIYLSVGKHKQQIEITTDKINDDAFIYYREIKGDVNNG